MSNQPEFDVFLAHHSGDKPFVREISRQLKQCGLKPWIDEEQIAPGRSFQEEIQKAIPIVKTAAIFIGREGLGRWQKLEVNLFISECTERDTTVIPVLLPGIDKLPEHLLILRRYSWIKFTNKNDNEALKLLVWGITDKKVEEELRANTPDFKTSFDNFLCSFKRNIRVAAKSPRIKLSIVTVIVISSFGVMVSAGTEWQGRQKDKETLEQAKTWQQKERYDECVRNVTSITQKSQIYAQAQKIVEQCSQKILEQAKQRFTDTGKITDVKSQIELIPQNSPIGKEAQNKLAQWADEIHKEAAIKAFKKCNWSLAATEGGKVNTNEEKKDVQNLVDKAISYQNATPLTCPPK